MQCLQNKTTDNDIISVTIVCIYIEENSHITYRHTSLRLHCKRSYSDTDPNCMFRLRQFHRCHSAMHMLQNQTYLK